MSCPGWYCGRTYIDDSTLSECGACPRGFRRNDTTFICEQCEDSPIFYDWLYLGFMVILVLVLHWFFIDLVAMKRINTWDYFRKDVLILHSSALVEVTLSSILTLLCTYPYGELNITSCKVRSLSDWYTLLHNPTPNYEKRVHCTQEGVYPLYTMVFMFYAFALVTMLLLRPGSRQGKFSIYAAMYFIPILTVIHALIGGLLYYAFPYLIVILSVVSSAAHFAIKIDQGIKSLVMTTFGVPRNIVILLGHWSLHAYGIIAITQLTNPTFHSLLILLVPLPTLYYILTARFTDPDKIHFFI